MFYSLPTETKLDVFKFLNFKQLYSIKQTNLYFRDFINNFEGELARVEFFKIIIDHINPFIDVPQILIKPTASNFKFSLNNEEIEEKWKNGFEKPIALYYPGQNSNINVLYLFRDKFSTPFYIHSFRLQLPTIIKSKEDIKIIYYYLNKLFNCSFERGNFRNFIFNPELIQLLFGRVPKQIYMQDCELFINDYDNENLFQYILNHLVGKILKVGLLSKEMEKYKDVLFKILTNGGNNFKQVKLKFYYSGRNLDFDMHVKMFCDQIVEYIATSNDCSKVVPFIVFDFSTSSSFQLSDRAEKVEIKQLNGAKYTNYQITNIHNSKVKFYFCYNECDIAISTFNVRIKIMKGEIREDEN